MPDPSTGSGSPRAESGGAWAPHVRARLSALRLSPTRENEIVEELSQHLDDRWRELVSAGTPEDEATRLALADFREGNLLARYMTRLRQAHAPAPIAPGASAGHVVGDLWQDLRYAARLCLRQPGFAAAAILSLALGIGVNTTMFTIVYGVLLRDLPYPEPDRLLRLVQAHSGGEVTMREYEIVKQYARTFEAVAAYRGSGERQLGRAEDQNWITTVAITTDFLRAFGVQPQIGREFTDEETRPGGPSVMILSDGVWRRAFGADPQILGRTIALNDTLTTVVGVLPAGFWFPQELDAALPLRNTGALDDTGTNTQLIARLRSDATIAQAQAELGTMTEQILKVARAHLARDYRGLAALGFRDWVVGDIRVNLLLLFGATGVLLLIACGDLALLLLTRFAARARELAVRAALGSSQRRILAQLLTENLFLAVAGAAVGVIAAHALVRVFVSISPFPLPASAPLTVNGTVLAFTVVTALTASVLMTLVPFLASRRLNIAVWLRAEGKNLGSSSIRARTRNAFIVAEVALSTTLLVAAGLLVQTLYRTTQQELGFVPEGLVTFETPFAPERNAADRQNLTRLLHERLSQIPGVVGVAATNVLPLTGQSNLPSQRDGHPEHSIGGMEVRPVTAEYFAVMGIPIHRGRAIGAADVDRNAPVVLVSETVARRWWPAGDAIGDRLTIGMYQGKRMLKDPPREVIGIAGDIKAMRLQAPPRPTVYVPMSVASGTGSMTWVVKTNARRNVAAQVRAVVDSIDRGQRITQLRTMEDIVASASATPRFNASLFSIFASVALVLTIVGLYGVLSFLVALRRQEIGTRMALGASASDVLGAFVRQGFTLTTIGVLLGLVAAWFVVRWLSTLLFGVPPHDPTSFAVVALLVIAVGCAASYVPARRAATIDPLVAMRAE